MGISRKVLHFDCFAGVSGDMVLGALFSLGVSPSDIEKGVRSLGIDTFSIRSEVVDRSGISSTKAVVDAPDQKNHRHLPEIERMIDGSELSEWVKESSKKIFRRLAVAEARVHGIQLEKVHFHEVGALDSIIDVVGSCIGFEILGVRRFSASKLHVGSGFVDMAHGKFPVPPPAVAELLTDIPFYSTEIEGELVTPTGAAIVSSLCEQFGPVPSFKVSATGYGAGGRDYKGFPNTLRLMIGEDEGAALQTETLNILETNIDDLDGESISYALESLLEAGALDCWLAPIQMKKGRPGTLISVLVRIADSEKLGAILLNETSSLGYRVIPVSRVCLDRKELDVETQFGSVSVKMVTRPDGGITFKVGHDCLKAIAKVQGIALADVREIVNAAVSESLEADQE